MIQRLQNFEMEKYVKLNEELLDDETNSQLLKLMLDVAKQLQDIVLQFKAVAKARGIRYILPEQRKHGAKLKLQNSTTTSFKKKSPSNQSPLLVDDVNKKLDYEINAVNE